MSDRAQVSAATGDTASSHFIGSGTSWMRQTPIKPQRMIAGQGRGMDRCLSGLSHKAMPSASEQAAPTSSMTGGWTLPTASTSSALLTGKGFNRPSSLDARPLASLSAMRRRRRRYARLHRLDDSSPWLESATGVAATLACPASDSPGGSFGSWRPGGFSHPAVSRSSGSVAAFVRPRSSGSLRDTPQRSSGAVRTRGFVAARGAEVQ